MGAPVELSADVYDTLELSALAYGGIGRGEARDDAGAPLCAAGHAIAAHPGKEKPGAWWADPGPVWVALSEAIGPLRCIGDWNDAVFRDGEGRIPFEEWCRRLNVVRSA